MQWPNTCDKAEIMNRILTTDCFNGRHHKCNGKLKGDVYNKCECFCHTEGKKKRGTRTSTHVEPGNVRSIPNACVRPFGDT